MLILYDATLVVNLSDRQGWQCRPLSNITLRVYSQTSAFGLVASAPLQHRFRCPHGFFCALRLHCRFQLLRRKDTVVLLGHTCPEPLHLTPFHASRHPMTRTRGRLPCRSPCPRSSGSTKFGEVLISFKVQAEQKFIERGCKDIPMPFLIGNGIQYVHIS